MIILSTTTNTSGAKQSIYHSVETSNILFYCKDP